MWFYDQKLPFHNRLLFSKLDASLSYTQRSQCSFPFRNVCLTSIASRIDVIGHNPKKSAWLKKTTCTKNPLFTFVLKNLL